MLCHQCHVAAHRKCQKSSHLYKQQPELCGGAFGFIDKILKKVPQSIKDRFVVRKDLPPAVRAALYNIGDKKITRLQACRMPVASAISWALNLISLGSFFRNMARQGYDKMFHLFLLAKLDDGSSWRFERNEVISLAQYNQQPEDAQEVFIAGRDLTLQGMWDKALEMKGPEIYLYDPIKCNCQDFVATMLGANGLLTPELRAYVVQDATHLLPTYAQKFGRWTTDLAAKFNHLIFGAGNRYSRYGIVPFYGGAVRRGGSGPLGDNYTFVDAIEKLEELINGMHSSSAEEEQQNAQLAVEVLDALFDDFTRPDFEWNADAVRGKTHSDRDKAKEKNDELVDEVIKLLIEAWQKIYKYRPQFDAFTAMDHKTAENYLAKFGAKWPDHVKLLVPDLFRILEPFTLRLDTTPADDFLHPAQLYELAKKYSYPGKWLWMTVSQARNKLHDLDVTVQNLGTVAQTLPASASASQKETAIRHYNYFFIQKLLLEDFLRHIMFFMKPAEEKWQQHQHAENLLELARTDGKDQKDEKDGKEGKDEKGAGWQHRRGGAYNPAAPPVTRASQDAKVAEAKAALLSHAEDFKRMAEAMLSGDRDTAMKVSSELVGHLAPYPGMGAMVPFLTGVADLLSHHTDPMSGDYHKNIRSYLDQAFDAIPFIGPAIKNALLPAAVDKFNAPADSYTGRLYKDPEAYKRFDGYKQMGYNPYYYAAQHGVRDDYWNITNPDEMRAYNAAHGTNYTVYGGVRGKFRAKRS